MRHAAVLAALGLAACFDPSYDHPTCGAGGACPDGYACEVTTNVCAREGGADVDAPAGGDVDAPIDALPIDGNDGAIAALCNPGDANLRACFDFNTGAVVNGAGTTLTFTSTGTSSVAAVVGNGLGLTSLSAVHFDETPALDLPGPLTFEAFVKLGTAPAAGGRAMIYDDDGEWAVSIDDQRRVLFGGLIGPQLALGVWTHVACVYDRANVFLYINGAVATQVARTGDLPTSASSGSNLGQNCPTGGDPLIGAVDEVRIWSTARTGADLAAAAARSDPP